MLERASRTAQEYDEHLSAAGEASESLLSGLTQSPKVTEAVRAFEQEVAAERLQAIRGHTSSAILGAANAVDAYLQGQDQMARTAQHNASTGDFSPALGAGHVRTGPHSVH